MEKIANRELYGVFFSPRIIRIIKSKRVGQGMWHEWGEEQRV
jgi:hypothetical protein